MLDKLTVRRRGELGRIGELIAVEELSAHGFTAILLLRERNQIYPFADIYAEREGRKFWISVKTRNKYRANGTLNTRYKIPANQTERAHDLEQAHPGADAAFIAISVVLSRKSCRCNEPPHSYSCYFGPLTILTRRNGIGMREEERSLYECFAENKPIPDNYDVSNLDSTRPRTA